MTRMKGMTMRAATRSALLAALFLAVYGGANWWASRQSDVGVWAFDWERHLPFVGVLIVPYLSLDAFFLVAPFLCRTREELRVLSARLAMAIAVAGAFFIAMPLRLVLVRPATDGWVGLLFDGFTALDQPFNLFPSLHITLAVILAHTYWRHTRGILRLVIASWFVLIGASALLTYQHQVVDVAGGFALAALVFYAVRERTPRTATMTTMTTTGNRRVALYYLLGAAAAAGVAVLLWPWGMLLLWPSVSLLIVSAAYGGGVGPSIFAKSRGKVPLSTWVILWPYLVGQRLSLAHYRRQCRAYDAVTPEIWIGRRLTNREAAEAVAQGVTAVVDLTADFDEATAFTRVAYTNLQTLDLTAPSREALDAAVRFISRHARDGIVYVHCKVGYSRSVAVVGACLLASGRARSTDEALAMIRRARPQVVIRPEVVTALQRFEADRAGVPTRHHVRRSMPAALIAALLCGIARLFVGAPRAASVTGEGPRIFYANHTSHLDPLAIWVSLPPETRARTRPIARRDYWTRDPIRRYLARRVFRVVFVDRPPTGREPARPILVAEARRSVARAANALSAGASLIMFPEGTRGSGDEIGPFKSGLFHLCRMRPDVELVPVFLHDLHRILPKGEVIPLPFSGGVTFGEPIRLRPGEDKHAFLARARAALVMVSQPCTSHSTVMSRAS